MLYLHIFYAYKIHKIYYPFYSFKHFSMSPNIWCLKEFFFIFFSVCHSLIIINDVYICLKTDESFLWLKHLFTQNIFFSFLVFSFSLYHVFSLAPTVSFFLFHNINLFLFMMMYVGMYLYSAKNHSLTKNNIRIVCGFVKDYAGFIWEYLCTH